MKALLEDKNTFLENFINSTGFFNNRESYDCKNVIWRDGSTKIISYDGGYSNTLLIVPSLINKSYIFDLNKKVSFIKFMQESSVNVFLIDWGEPIETEYHYDIEDYIKEKLDKIINFIIAKKATKISMLGYCLGGLIAIASAIRNSDKINSLTLIATPWDFQSQKFARIKLDDISAKLLSKKIEKIQILPAHIIQSIFSYLHIDSIPNKYSKLSKILESNLTDELENFMSIECWANDGISMPSKLVNTCFIDFMHYNNTKNLCWKIDGNVINPQDIEIPVCFINSQKDKIVPLCSTYPLINNIKNKHIITTNVGHVSMVAGLKAKECIWKPYLQWLSKTITR